MEKKCHRHISEIKPDVVISGNCPTLAQEYIIKVVSKKKK